MVVEELLSTNQNGKEDMVQSPHQEVAGYTQPPLRLKQFDATLQQTSGDPKYQTKATPKKNTRTGEILWEFRV